MARVMRRIGVLLGMGLIVLGCESGGQNDGPGESLACAPGEVDCGDGCVSLVANSSHCGACDNACLSGLICVDMACACPGGGTLCDQSCAVTLHDDANCGRCGNRCSAGFGCRMGQCQELAGDGSGGATGGGAPTDGGRGGETAGANAAGTNSAGGGAGGATSTGAGGDVELAGGASGSGPDAAGGRGSGVLPGSGSPGCGASNPPDGGRYSIEVADLFREYIVDLPPDYDRDRPYALVVAWHWFGGTAYHVATGVGDSFLGPYYGLEAVADGAAIFVAPEGIDNGWANPHGRDVAFARELVDRLQAEYCIDIDRIFSTGFSYGAMMSNAVGCAMPDVFRAVAPVSGSLASGCVGGNAPLAWWSAHGTADFDVPVEDGREARDEFLERNGCGTDAAPTDPSPCVAYDGCATDDPVVWCEWGGGHFPPEFAPQAIWDFFSALE